MVAVSIATLTLLPSEITAIILGGIVCAAGVLLIYAGVEQWRAFANICVVVGAILFGGGVVTNGQGSVGAFFIVALTFAGAGVFSRSWLLTALSVIALASCIGPRTDGFPGRYLFGFEGPTFTILLFTLFSFGTYRLSQYLTASYRNMAIVASRTGIFLVNSSFWIGSLNGDHKMGSRLIISKEVFAIFWAILLIGLGMWAWKKNRRWLINAVAVFGAIHFYTQWFERLGARSESVLIAGLLTLGFALGLRRLNLKMSRKI